MQRDTGREDPSDWAFALFQRRARMNRGRDWSTLDEFDGILGQYLQPVPDGFSQVSVC
jgi:hypothetical protein